MKHDRHPASIMASRIDLLRAAAPDPCKRHLVFPLAAPRQPPGELIYVSLQACDVLLRGWQDWAGRGRGFPRRRYASTLAAAAAPIEDGQGAYGILGWPSKPSVRLCDGRLAGIACRMHGDTNTPITRFRAPWGSSSGGEGFARERDESPDAVVACSAR